MERRWERLGDVRILNTERLGRRSSGRFGSLSDCQGTFPPVRMCSGMCAASSACIPRLPTFSGSVTSPTAFDHSFLIHRRSKTDLSEIAGQKSKSIGFGSKGLVFWTFRK
ncbi:hypothetical protein AVEN_54663-1 [Araneus ventricosus]|uniref:Uncharacterized protein n=1 Tax=Araneus ventricosus TaxID=182803 RepID=A0A4Y2BL98_ARAVE|nr:hypothetical protein AVEN_54663-1 [Araneus ventricosus]